MSKALAVFVGSNAAKRLESEGWDPNIFSLLLGASGGPKWLILNQLDKYLFGSFLIANSRGLRSLGSSIGAWRHACLAQKDPLLALERMEHEYLYQRYSSERPSIQEVTEVAEKIIDTVLADNLLEITSNPNIQTAICVSRERYTVQRDNNFKLAVRLAKSAFSNILSRKLLKNHFERVIFQTDCIKDIDTTYIGDVFATETVVLSRENIKLALLATAAIPFLVNPILDIPGTSCGTYWDGGIIDYHFDLSSIQHEGLILYPHFRNTIIPGWFDKSLKWRYQNCQAKKNMVLICPSSEFIASLPGKKIPDRTDFRTMKEDHRIKVWEECIRKSKVLAEEMQALIENNDPLSGVDIIQ